MLTMNFPLTTTRLTLRPFQDTDLSDIFEYHADPEVVRYMYWNVRDLDQTRAELEKKKRKPHSTVMATRSIWQLS